MEEECRDDDDYYDAKKCSNIEKIHEMYKSLFSWVKVWAEEKNNKSWNYILQLASIYEVEFSKNIDDNIFEILSSIDNNNEIQHHKTR